MADMSSVNTLALALDKGSDLAAVVRSIQVATTFFSLWAGTLGWDIFYYVVWDLELILSPGWSSPVRALTRTSYLFSRYLAFASLLLALFFWVEGWSENACIVLPFVYEGILVLSYGFTLIILALRTLSLYPGDSKFDRFVQWLTAIGLLNILVWGSVHVKEAGGNRMAGTTSRCGYAEDEMGLFLIRGMLLSTVIFNTVMFALTLYKIYVSGSQHFFNRKTIIGRLFNPRASSSKNRREPAGNHLAASLITQGLYSFFCLLVVDIVALVCSIVLTTNLYRQMSVISMGAFSAVLGAGLFRETYRAALSISATQQLELRLIEARDQMEKRNHPFQIQSERKVSRNVDVGYSNEETENLEESMDHRSRSQTTERSIAHPNYVSNSEISSIENLAETNNDDEESIIPRSSFESKDLDLENFSESMNLHHNNNDNINSFENLPHLNHNSSPSNLVESSNSANEPHPFVPYSNPTKSSNKIKQISLMSGLSLHAFDDGVTASSKNGSSSTLGEVSILGAALPNWARANSQNFHPSDPNIVYRSSEQNINGRERYREKEGEGFEMDRDRSPLPPPRKAVRKGSRYHQ